jgi:spore coat protein H
MSRRLFWALLVVTAPAAAGVKDAAESERFFHGPDVPRFVLTLDDANLKQIRQDPRKYVRATVRDRRGEYKDVGMHLKGAAGSFRHFDDKPALTLNFDKFAAGQRYHGIDKLHLNNSVQDPTYLTEIVCGEMFLKAGVPTARATHALVELQGKPRGLYVLKEGYDRTFLRRHFKNPNGNLYDGEFLRDIDQPLKASSGGDDVPDRGDLKALAAACREPDLTKRKERVERVLDLDRFITLAAIEVLTWHWDGYCMKANNFRVYHDPTADKVIIIPHGMDQMFWEAGGPITAPNGGLVARAVFDVPEFRKRYYARVAELRKLVLDPDQVGRRIDELTARVVPALEEAKPGWGKEFAARAAGLKEQIRKRAASVDKQLADRAARGK